MKPAAQTGRSVLPRPGLSRPDIAKPGAPLAEAGLRVGCSDRLDAAPLPSRASRRDGSAVVAWGGARACVDMVTSESCEWVREPAALRDSVAAAEPGSSRPTRRARPPRWRPGSWERPVSIRWARALILGDPPGVETPIASRHWCRRGSSDATTGSARLNKPRIAWMLRTTPLWHAVRMRRPCRRRTSAQT